MKPIVSQPEITDTHRLGATFMIVHAGYLLAQLFLVPISQADSVSQVMAVIFELLFAVYIFRESTWHRSVVMQLIRLRIVAGGLIAIATSLEQVNYWGLAVQSMLIASLALLFFGKGNGIKRGLSAGLFGLYTIGMIASTALLLDRPANMADQYGLIEIADVTPSFATVLPEPWMVREYSSYVQESPAVNLWFVDPTRDSHIMVIYEDISQLTVEHEHLVEQVVRNAEAAGEVTLLSSRTDLTDSHNRTLMRTRVSTDVGVLSYYYCILSNDREAIQVICFSRESNFEASLPDFERLIEKVSSD
jgi:hypothetical protein